MTAREVLGGQKTLTLDVNEATIADLIQELSIQFGQSFEHMFFDSQSGAISERVAILVNGRHYTHLPHRLNTALQDGDDVALFPPIAGG